MNFRRLFFRTMDALAYDSSVNQISSGFALGLIVGMTPWETLHGVLFVILCFLLRVNIAALISTAIVGAVLSWAFQPVIHLFGKWLLLEVSWLLPFWQVLARTPFVVLTKFNHSVVLGNFVIAVVLAIPVYVIAKLTLTVHGERFSNWVRERALLLAWQIFRTVRNYVQETR